MLWLCGVLYYLKVFHHHNYILRNAVIWMFFMALIEICDDQPEDHKLFKKVNELGVVM